MVTDPWDATFNTSPLGSESKRLGDNRIRETRLGVQERLDIDHDFSALGAAPNSAETGYHTKATLKVRTNPTAVANTIILFAKDVGGKAELHSIDEDSNVIQWSDVGALLCRLPQNDIDGFALTTDTDTLHDFSFDTGECRDTANTKNCILSSALVKEFDSNFSEGDAAGGMATGIALPTSGTVHFFMAEKDASAGTFDIIGDTSVTMANGVTGWTMRRRIGSRITDGSDDFIGTTQKGNVVLLDVPIGDFNASNPTTSAVLRAMSVPIDIKVWALSSYHLYDPTPLDAAYLVTSPDQTDTAPLAAVVDLLTTTAAEFASTYKPVLTNTSAQVRTRSTASDGTLQVRGTTFGWIDYRGRDD